MLFDFDDDRLVLDLARQMSADGEIEGVTHACPQCVAAEQSLLAHVTCAYDRRVQALIDRGWLWPPRFDRQAWRVYATPALEDAIKAVRRRLIADDDRAMKEIAPLIAHHLIMMITPSGSIFLDDHACEFPLLAHAPVALADLARVCQRAKKRVRKILFLDDRYIDNLLTLLEHIPAFRQSCNGRHWTIYRPDLSLALHVQRVASAYYHEEIRLYRDRQIVRITLVPFRVS